MNKEMSFFIFTSLLSGLPVQYISWDSSVCSNIKLLHGVKIKMLKTNVLSWIHCILMLRSIDAVVVTSGIVPDPSHFGYFNKIEFDKTKYYKIETI